MSASASGDESTSPMSDGASTPTSASSRPTSADPESSNPSSDASVWAGPPSIRIDMSTGPLSRRATAPSPHAHRTIAAKTTALMGHMPATRCGARPAERGETTCRTQSGRRVAPSVAHAHFPASSTLLRACAQTDMNRPDGARRNDPLEIVQDLREQHASPGIRRRRHAPTRSAVLAVRAADVAPTTVHGVILDFGAPYRNVITIARASTFDESGIAMRKADAGGAE